MALNSSVNPAVLTSSPIRQLYEVLSVFEANRDWSNNARAQLLERVAARLPPIHQPDQFVLSSSLEEMGLQSAPELSLNEKDTIPGISILSRNSTRQQEPILPAVQTNGSGSSRGTAPTLSPQLAKVMTTREMAVFAMLKMFSELSEQRIESWGRVARLIVTQPMDGFAAVKPEWTAN